VPGSILAAVTPDNTPAGAVLTFAFPLGLFIVIAVILYLRFARPHRRVPAAAAGRATPAAAVPGPGTARGAGPNPAGQSAPGPGPSNVSGRDGAPAGPDGPEDGAADGGKASE
jgi:hypothetical protein